MAPDLEIFTCWLIREADGTLCWWARWEYETMPPRESYVVTESRKRW
jgi:hypothetical protein